MRCASRFFSCRRWISLACRSVSARRLRSVADKDSRCSASRCGGLVSAFGSHQRASEWKRKTHVAPKNQIVDNGNNPAHGGGNLAAGVTRVGEINALAIAQQSSREQLVVDVERRLSQMLELDHGKSPRSVMSRRVFLKGCRRFPSPDGCRFSNPGKITERCGSRNAPCCCIPLELERQSRAVLFIWWGSLPWHPRPTESTPHNPNPTKSAI